MAIEIKILIHWIVTLAVLYAITHIQYFLSAKSLDWKYFLNEHSYFGVAYSILKILGTVIICAYIIFKVIYAWYN